MMEFNFLSSVRKIGDRMKIVTGAYIHACNYINSLPYIVKALLGCHGDRSHGVSEKHANNWYEFGGCPEWLLLERKCRAKETDEHVAN